MPRHARIVAAGYPMHAILRGIDGAAVVLRQQRPSRVPCRADRAGSDRVGAGARLRAYVSMTNHLHLTPATVRGPARFMKGVGQRFAQHVNRTYGHTGTLFEGRFRSALLEADAYLLACPRYIELNPVRARMVHAPGDCLWSSYRANALGNADRLVNPHPLYAALAKSDDPRRFAYRRLFADALPETSLSAIRSATNGGWVLGSDRFGKEIAVMVGRRTWRGKSGRPKKRGADGDRLDLPIRPELRSCWVT